MDLLTEKRNRNVDKKVTRGNILLEEKNVSLMIIGISLRLYEEIHKSYEEKDV